MANKYVQLDRKDTVIVALQDMFAGEEVTVKGELFFLKEDVKAKHKFALVDFKIGDEIYMYGVLVGKATAFIAKGSTITTTNVVHASTSYEVEKSGFNWSAPAITKYKDKTFNGYHREDGSVGTANYWLVIPMVFCENRNLDVIESAMSEALGYIVNKDFNVDTQALINHYKNGASTQELLDLSIVQTKEEEQKNRVFPNVDGIKFLRHNGGCGGTRDDATTLCNLLAGYITNANVAGATILSLGCQNAETSILQKAIAQRDPNFSKPIHYLEQQQSKNERSFIEDAVKLTFTGLIQANETTRKPAPLSKLILGLECGASDGFSGISANPALGYASDLLVALGGSPVLAEFPELNGVEQELLNRCASKPLAEKFSSLMRAYSKKAIAVGSGFDKNPSPGNIKDGLITDAMKSAGAAKKGGTSPIVDVLDYTEKVAKGGLNLLCTPGNDVESTTGLVGSGCTVVVFTTGLGTPTGNPIAPVIKLSSNTALFNKMNDIIDINAGTVISGEDSIQSMGEKVLDHLIDIASGKTMAKAVLKGNNDFIPWKRGVSL